MTLWPPEKIFSDLQTNVMRKIADFLLIPSGAVIRSVRAGKINSTRVLLGGPHSDLPIFGYN